MTLKVLKMKTGLNPLQCYEQLKRMQIFPLLLQNLRRSSKDIDSTGLTVPERDAAEKVSLSMDKINIQ